MAYYARIAIGMADFMPNTQIYVSADSVEELNRLIADECKTFDDIFGEGGEAGQSSDPHKYAFRAPREAARLRKGALKERKAQEAREAAATAVEQWRQGANGGALLRVSASLDALQTSLGASVPLADAIRVFRFVKLCRERGIGWHRNGDTLPVGGFQVDYVAPNGTLRAGCHLIHWKEIERLAIALRLQDIESEDTCVKASA